MTQYDFDRVVDRKGTFSLKWENIALALPTASDDCLPLWVADMDFPCAEPIIKALHERVDRLIFGYSVQSHPSYYAAVTGWFQRRFNWQIDHDDIFFSPGVVPAIGFLLEALSEVGDGIIIQPPVYYPFAKKISEYGRTIVTNPLIYQDGRYTIDFADLEDKLSQPSNKGMILCSPHNPAGRVWTKEELWQIASLSEKYQKWIISDEIHCDIIRCNQTHIPLEKVYPQYKEHIFTCTAPSKTFNLAGLQLSNIIIHDAQVKDYWFHNVINKVGLSSPNAFAIVAAIAAYNEGEEWLEAVKRYLDDNVRYVEEFVQNNLPKIKVVPCEGTYLMWLDFSAYGLQADELEKMMQKKAKVALDEGYIFGEQGAGFERINIACPRSILMDCMMRIKNALSNV